MITSFINYAHFMNFARQTHTSNFFLLYMEWNLGPVNGTLDCTSSGIIWAELFDKLIS